MSMASPCFNTSSVPMDLNKLQGLPVEAKATYSKMIIQRFYIQERGKVYVSYSGGKDSTVLLHLVRSLYPDVPAVFSDTGLEFPEIRDFVRSTPDVTIIRPDTSFRKVIETEGYPIVGKEVAATICNARRGMPSAIKVLDTPTTESRYGKAHYKFLLDAPFGVSSKCCDHLKKAPFRIYEKETGRAGIIGTKAEDSQLRALIQMKEGEIRDHQCAPLGIWTDEDIWEYIRIHELDYCHVYDMGYKATGCVFCMFGIMSDRHRFLKLKATHPKLWEYCMKPWSEGGLGIKEVCDYLGIPTGCNQTNLNQYQNKEARVGP